MDVSQIAGRADAAANLLKVLSNAQRLLILCHLCEGELSVGALEARMGMRQPHLSQHLARMRRDGIVKARRSSRSVFYSIGNGEAAAILKVLYQVFCDPGRGRCASRTSIDVAEEAAAEIGVALLRTQPAALTVP